MRGKALRGVAAAMVCGGMGVPATASAAQLTVDDDRVQCPSAGYTSIAAAVGAAAPGDVVSICDGVYREGAGGANTNAITIYKPLTLRGAGAGRVFVIPNGGPSNTLVPAGPANFRDAGGNIISVVDTRADISGITVFGDRVAVDAGINFHESNGSVISVEVVDLIPAAGLGSTDGGIGVVVHNAPPDPPNPLPVPNPTGLLKSVTIRDSVVEGYNKAGIVVDATRPDGTPSDGAALPLRGAFAAVVNNSVKGAGNQSAIAQNGIQFSGGSTGVIVENGVSDNSFALDRTASAGIRFDQSSNTSQTRVNLNGLQGNGMGLANVPRTGTYRIDAVRNWWGSPLGPSAADAPGRGDAVSGTMAGNGGTPNRTESVDFQEFLTVPAPLDVALNEWQDRQPSVSLDVDDELELSSAASDDIGIRSVTFFSGDDVIAVDRTAPYAATWEPDEALEGTAQVVLAVAEDSRGQTSVAAKAVAIGDLPAPEPEPKPDPVAPQPTVLDDAAPRVTLSAPVRAGARFTATAATSDDRGIASVAFLLGTRQVCLATAAPYTCEVEAGADDVGRQTLTAVVTDSAGQTGTSMRAVTIAKFKASALSQRTVASRGRLTTSGKLTLPAGLRASDACGGELTVSYRRGSRTVASKRVKVSSACGYSARVKLAKGTYQVSVSYHGSSALAAIKASTRKAAVR